MIKLRLVGCSRYNFRGELYEAGKVYAVGNDKGKVMLGKQDPYGRKFFARYEPAPEKSAAQLAADAAKIAAIAAAQLAAEENRTEEVIERPDGSEPDKVDTDSAGEIEQPVVVDTDDDPSLDEDTVASPEEIVVDDEADEEEDPDRADGSEVEI